MVLANYEAAINLYVKALEKYTASGDLEIELYLAKAYFKNDQFDQSTKILKSLMHRFPQDLRVRFDLAICLYEHAQVIFNKQNYRVAETEEAISYLMTSQKLMNFIRYQPDASFYLQHPSQEARHLAEFQLKFMRGVCEDNMNELSMMLQESHIYLEHSKRQEYELKLKEDEKLNRVKVLQDAIE
jgi:tetratricopeptide (TPR) repeat protein